MLEKFKVLVFVLVGVLVLTLVGGNSLSVMAATTTDGYEYVIPDASNEYWVIYNYLGKYYFVATTGLLVQSNSTLKPTTSIGLQKYLGTVTDNTINFSLQSSQSSTKVDVSFDTIVASNYDILNSDGSLFFQPPPEQTRLQIVVTALSPEMEPEKVLKEILTMVPLLIPLLAGCLGLRKALRFLSQILRTA